MIYDAEAMIYVLYSYFKIGSTMTLNLYYTVCALKEDGYFYLIDSTKTFKLYYTFCVLKEGD